MVNTGLRGRGVVIYLTLCVAMLVLMCDPGLAQAAASLTLTGGDWAIGALKGSATSATTGDTWTITNDGDGEEDFEISVAVTSGTWAARTINDNTNASNEFILREDTSAGKLITGNNVSLTTSVVEEGTYSFDLWFKAPPAGSTEEAETLTVTVTATNWVSSFLSWAGSTHREADCTVTLGGTVYDTGATGTICKVTSATVPAGWTQAANWQRYSVATWGGDSCGYHLSHGPVTFANTVSGVKSAGSGVGSDYPCSSSYWNVAGDDGYGTVYYGYYAVSETPNISTNRVEVGVY